MKTPNLSDVEKDCNLQATLFVSCENLSRYSRMKACVCVGGGGGRVCVCGWVCVYKSESMCAWAFVFACM